jgi:hypothetical protein
MSCPAGFPELHQLRGSSGSTLQRIRLFQDIFVYFIRNRGLKLRAHAFDLFDHFGRTSNAYR